MGRVVAWHAQALGSVLAPTATPGQNAAGTPLPRLPLPCISPHSDGAGRGWRGRGENKDTKARDSPEDAPLQRIGADLEKKEKAGGGCWVSGCHK